MAKVKPNKYKIKPNGKKATGRPSAFTDEVINKLEEALKRDCTIKMACAYAWISTQSYYEECKRNKKFSDRMDKAEQYLHILAQTKFADKIRDNEWEAIKEFKKKRDPRYKDRIQEEKTYEFVISKEEEQEFDNLLESNL